jgi:hypothetical protein
MNTSRAIVSHYKIKKKRGQKSTNYRFKVDLARIVKIDTTAECLQNIRVVRWFTPKEVRTMRHQQKYHEFSGFKIVSRDLRGFNDFQYQVGAHHHHQGPVSLRFSGFHFAADPLHCLSYTDHLEKPHRLLVVRGSGGISCDHISMCSRDLYVEKEVTDQKEKDELLSGIIRVWDQIIPYSKGDSIDAVSDVTPDVRSALDSLLK